MVFECGEIEIGIIKGFIYCEFENILVRELEKETLFIFSISDKYLIIKFFYSSIQAANKLINQIK